MCSALKTLAGKHKSTVTKMARRYKASVDTPDGKRICFQATVQREKEKKPLVARFGGRPRGTGLPRQTPHRAADPSGWCMNARRNARDYERLPQHSEAHLNWALITMMTRRLTRKSPRTSQWTKKPPS